MGDLDPIYNTWFLEPTRDQGTNGISVGSAVFAGLTTVTNRQTDRQTDHATSSVTTGRIYVVLRCGLNIGLLKSRVFGKCTVETSEHDSV